MHAHGGQRIHSCVGEMKLEASVAWQWPLYVVPVSAAEATSTDAALGG